MENKKSLSIEELVAQELQTEKQIETIIGGEKILSENEEKELEKTKEYLEKVSKEIEQATAGVTNMLAMMKSGTIPASYKDVALLFANVNINIKQLKTVQDDAKSLVLTDPSTLPSFNYNGLNFKSSVKETEVFDSARWKKEDKVGYDLIRSKYLKKRPLRKLTFEAVGGGS